MTKGKRGPIDYVRKRSGSKFLWFRYYWPKDIGGGMRELSLGTTDMQVARGRAAIHLIECINHVEELRARQSATAERRPATTLEWLYPVGKWPLPDGGHVQADEEICYFVASDGGITSKPRLVRRVIDGPGMTLAEYRNRLAEDTLFENEIGGIDAPGWRGEAIDLPKSVTRPEQCSAPIDGGIVAKSSTSTMRVRPGADDEYLEIYLKHRNITGYLEREARASWSKFRELTNGKPLKDCDRAEGRKLVEYYFSQGNKRATVQKKLMYLGAMVNLALDDPKSALKFNPFIKIIPNIHDAVKRWPMPEEDVKLIRDNKHTFKSEQWLLYLLCATTGMRREEAFSIENERVEAGIPYVIVGTKTEQSLRRVPLPDDICATIPAKITGPVFAPHLTSEGERKHYLKNLGREVLRQMERIGVSTPGLHSLRHRAKDRLRDAGVTHDQQEELLGHEKKTVADGYGRGYPVRILKEWVETIGY